VSGPEYYGLAYPEIKRLIQDLPNAHLCATKPMGRGCYKWQDFGDGPLNGPALSVPTAPLPPPPASSTTTAPDQQVDSKDFALAGAPGAGGSGQGSDGAGGAPKSAEDSAWDELDALQKEARQVCEVTMVRAAAAVARRFHQITLSGVLVRVLHVVCVCARAFLRACLKCECAESEYDTCISASKLWVCACIIACKLVPGRR